MQEENYKSQVIGIKQIALEQYKRCLLLGSKNILNDPYQREEYINAVLQMEICIYPEIDPKKHKAINEKFQDNEKKINALQSDYKAKLKELKEKAGRKEINHSKMSRDYERKLIELYHEKLINISLMLKQKNYYEEEVYVDGL